MGKSGFGFTVLFIFISLFLAGCSIFFPYTISIEVTPIEGGTVEISPSANRYGEGDIITLEARAEDGFVFSAWEGDLSGYSSEEELFMDGDKNITAFFESTEPRDWTIMVYLDGDNNLEAEAFLDMEAMEQGFRAAEDAGTGFPDNSYILVLVDCLGESDDYGWSGTRLYRLRSDGGTAEIDSERLDDGAGGFGHLGTLGELNMGDPATLSWFIERCMSFFPSDKYGLILWNHGGGARGLEPRGICEDSENDDILNLNEVQQAVSSGFTSEDKLAFLGMDACLMGTVEVAYEFRNLVSYMTFSPANEWGGWAYDDIFGTMTGSTTPEELAKMAAEAYKEKSLAYGLTQNTQTAADLGSITALKTALDNLAAAFSGSGDKTTIEGLRDSATHYYSTEYVYEPIAWPYFEIGSLCDKITASGPSVEISTALGSVKSALEDVIVYAWAGSESGGYDGAGIGHGLSVFFSRGEQLYSSESHYAYQWWYTDTAFTGATDGGIDFADSDTDGTVETWREIFEKWYDPYIPPYNSETDSLKTPGAY